MLTAVFVAALLQSAAINIQRDAYIACLKQAAQTATSQKMLPDAFEAFARLNCTTVESSFKGALVAFDLKNKVPRKQAASDAQVQADDFVISIADRYKATAPK